MRMWKRRPFSRKNTAKCLYCRDTPSDDDPGTVLGAIRLNIYAVELKFDGAYGLDPVLEQVSSWFVKKMKRKMSIGDLPGGNSQLTISDQKLLVSKCLSARSAQIAIRFTHPDEAVKKRRWITEIGITKGDSDGPIAFSLLLRTQEDSPIAGLRPLETTRPWLIEQLVAKCHPLPSTVGLKLRKVPVAKLAELAALIADPRRKHALAIVSATPMGNYLLSTEKLQGYCVGLAECVELASSIPADRLRKSLPPGTAPWDGALNLVFPSVRSTRGPGLFIPSHKFTPPDFETMEKNSQDPARKILEAVAHRTNSQHAGKAISIEAVQLLNIRLSLDTKRKLAGETGGQKEFIKLLEEYQLTLEGDIKMKTAAIAELNEALEEERYKVEEREEEHKEELRAATAKAEVFQAAANQMATRTTGDVAKELSDSVAAALLDKPTLEQALRTLLVAYPDRLVILEPAWNSAKDSECFKHQSASWDLLKKLSGEYWESLAGGTGDHEARKIFGTKFVATDSDKVENNQRARQLRTFIYKGKPIQMFKHLRLGVKDSAAETLRVYFEWDPADKKIVIGHCGEHLDHG